MSDIVRFTNGYLALPDGTVSHPSPLPDAPFHLFQRSSQAAKADLYVNAATGLIISDASEALASDDLSGRVIDLDGNLLAPGLIDAQINGAYGVDFSELNTEAFEGGEAEYANSLDEVAGRIVQTGCTSFVPTIMSVKEELYGKVSGCSNAQWSVANPQLLTLLRPRSTPGNAHALGYHAEGPFLHPGRRGAHAETRLRDAARGTPVEVLEGVYGADGLDQPGVKLITLAPDVDGVMQCIPELVHRGVIVSIGHR